jgi:hypothetical protein
MSSVVKQRVRLTPNNEPNGGSYSAQNFPMVNFVIGKQNGWIETRSLRLNGSFELRNAVAGGTPFVLNDGTAAASNQNGASVNNYIGVQSLFDEVQCSTLNGRSLECVRSYSRAVCVGKPMLNNSLEYANGLGLKDPTQTNKSVTNARTVNQRFDFSIPIEVGMFEGKLLNVSEKGFHGLQLDFLLSQNATVVQPYIQYLGPAAGSTVPPETPITALQTHQFKIDNLSLTFDMIRADAKLFASMPSSGLLSYQTISTLNSTLLSSDQTLVLRLSARNVISVTHTMIPAVHVNNIKQNSFRLSLPRTGSDAATLGIEKKVKSVQYMRAGVLYPYNFILDSEKQADVALAGNPAVQAQIMKPFQNSVSLYDNSATKFSPNTNLGIRSSVMSGNGLATPLSVGGDPNTIFGLGVPMDSNAQGVSFKDREYSVRIQSELDDTTANTFFTFTRVRNVAQYSPTGITVLE